MTEPTYVGLSGDGTPEDESNSSSIMLKALKPKTEIQRRLLDSSGAKHFVSTAERNLWKQLEAPALASDDDGLVHKAWLINCIEWVERSNRKVKRLSYRSAIYLARKEESMTQWKIQNRDKILKKKSADEVASETGVGKMTEAYSSEDT